MSVARGFGVLLLALWTLLPGVLAAQEQAVLIADRIFVEPGGILRAEGNVEVLFEGTRLRASAITYNRTRDNLTIQGPLSLSQGEEFVLLADAGSLDQDFRNGILTSARLVLNQQMQIAASEINRVDGRYTQLTKAVASTCPVCAASDVPLWQIRASRVIHDIQEKRLYFENALFEVVGIPIFYLPRLQMPDASVDRATGFLIPRFKDSSVLGTGVQIPYFIDLGPHSDVTLTPYVSSQTTTVGLRYRQLWKRGAAVVNAAVSDDNLLPGNLRGYVFGQGLFFLDRGYELGIDLKFSSGDSYLFDYGISGQDRLRSDVELRRVRSASHFSAEAIAFTSFRDDKSAETIPSRIADINHLQRISPGFLGGEAEYRLQAYGLYRSSNVDITGRDYGRLSAGLGWRRGAILGPGLLAEAEAQIDLNHFQIAQDSSAQSSTELTAVAATKISWPLTRTGADGAVHILEPAAQLVFSSASDTGVPNEESTLVEFDEGNLWSLDRLPGSSAYEIGSRLNAGVTWTRYDPDGWSGALTFGRVFRTTDAGQFNEATGLAGLHSDWMISGRLTLGPDLSFSNRMLLSDALNLNRNDARLRWSYGRLVLGTNFLWHISEPEVGRDLDTWELHADARYQLAANWTSAVDMRYDFVTDRTASVGLNLSYLNPCLTVDFGYSRSFTSSTAVTPKTDFTISLSVPQGAVASKRAKHSCGG